MSPSFSHVQSLCFKFYPRHKALRFIATASWGPTKESLSLLYKAFVRPVLTHASAGWFLFLCNTATNHLEMLHRAACRVITGCLSSTPSSKANSRTSNPLLLQTCSAPPPRLLQPLCPCNKKRSLSTKEETLLEIILFFGHTTTLIPT